MHWNDQIYLWRLVPQRPWIGVFDGDGFPDFVINDYITFAAWQDYAPSTVRSDARCLAYAAMWLKSRGYTWASTDLTRWAEYCICIAMDHSDGVPVVTRAVRHIAALHRAYAFWHWANPHGFPFQPFHARHSERVVWVHRTLDSRGPNGLPTSSPYL